jgi:hypothetical protein
MTQLQLRRILFFVWAGSYCIAVALMIFTPVIRGDMKIADDQTMKGVLSITGFWLPPLTCFCAFWFPKQERNRARSRRVTKDQVAAGITLTAAYVLMILACLWRVCITAGYVTQTPEGLSLPPGAEFEERLADLVRYGLLLSPIAIAPTAWLSGVSPSETG